MHVFRKMPSIIAPKPQRPLPVAVINNRAGLSSQYEIESYATPQPTEAPLPTFTPPPALLSMMHKPLDPYDETYEPQPHIYATPSLYPRQVQSAITPSITPEPMPNYIEPRVAQLSRSPTRPLTRSPTQKHLRLHQPSPAEPEPLGNWPRRSVLASSSRKVHRKLPPVNASPGPTTPDPRPLPQISSIATPSPAPHVSTPPVVGGSAAPQTTAPPTSYNPSSITRARPSGPRRRSGEARVAVPEFSLATSHQPSR
ncbi:hypothetical protein C0992_008846 [Termitomyces sp. T32_za158]|nr:hypothetical protein C0992_008846 [Termitomyces sp. T32_za158]